MKKILFILGCAAIFSTASYANNCEQIKQQIAEKIEANGVTDFTLDVIEKGSPTNKKIVGVCGQGTKSIVYQKGNAVEPDTTQTIETNTDNE